MFFHKSIKRKIFTLFCCFLTVAGIGCSKKTGAHTAGATADSLRTQAAAPSCAVYSVLLNDWYVRDGVTQVFIVGETSLDHLSADEILDQLKYLNNRSSNYIPEDVIEDFLAANRQPHLLEDCFDIKPKTTLLDRNEVQKIYQSPDGWGDFLQMYPQQSLITLSRIGFNQSQDKALVYTGTQSGGKSGGGGFALLTKEKERWIIARSFPSWGS